MLEQSGNNDVSTLNKFSRLELLEEQDNMDFDQGVVLFDVNITNIIANTSTVVAEPVVLSNTEKDAVTNCEVSELVHEAGLEARPY